MSQKSTKKSFRLRFPFWLDMHKPDEADLAETIAILKDERAFVKTVRDGIRLVCDLKAGRLEVLFSLFPWVKAEFDKRGSPQAVNALQDQLARLERLMEQGVSIPVDTQPKSPASMPAGPKPLSVPAMAAPQFDDDDFSLAMRKKADYSTTANLIRSLKGC